MIDVDVGTACTGACCENFTLVEAEALLSHAQHATMKMEFGERDLARLAVPTSTEYRFNCTKFDPISRRCTDYVNRPDTCRTFPRGVVQMGKLSDTCRHCGFTALQLTSQALETD